MKKKTEVKAVKAVKRVRPKTYIINVTDAQNNTWKLLSSNNKDIFLNSCRDFRGFDKKQQKQTYAHRNFKKFDDFYSRGE